MPDPGLEQIADGSPVDRNFQRIAALFRSLLSVLIPSGLPAGVAGFNIGSLGIRFGAATVTFPGATPVSTLNTISHGLGHAPAGVFATAVSGSSTAIAWCATSNYTTTSFDIVMEFDPDRFTPSAGTPSGFVWIAVG